ncbi:MAG: tRNA (N(6)-L-threonylcarbamoyladenosine(37)-C(2))-methylthiotransferase MtaB [Hymenobacteraceae bacterium]|nr:tRNA (N(6)-L-threonylcarbamoyladenosine(37)-C(2))-methylthiotransferase MtaB [Hymenobacteraceae bacterium]
MNSIAFYTLGCKLNFSESSALARSFEARGWTRKEFHEGADVVVVNTCSVTDHADRKCKKVVQEARRRNAHARVVIVGCYAQLKPQEIATIPGVSAVFGAAEKFELAHHVEAMLANPAADAAPLVLTSPIAHANTFVPAYSAGDRTRTFLKVQDGCDYSCTFCTIPLARGQSRSGDIASVLAQVTEIAASSTAQEIVLTGVNLGDFGLDSAGIRRETFTGLARHLAVAAPATIQRFRISSLEPNLLTDEVIELVAAGARFMPHFHLPLQSGADRILRAMRRRYLTKLYADRIARVNVRIPHCGIGVDVIVGFPGETDADFRQTYEFLAGLPITYLHVFPYSERANTPAATLPGRVPERVRSERTEQLRQLSERKRRAFAEAHLGTVARVLIEADLNAAGQLEGYTENYIRVAVPYDPLLVGEIREVRLMELTPAGLVLGEEVAEYAAH